MYKQNKTAQNHKKGENEARELIQKFASLKERDRGVETKRTWRKNQKRVRKGLLQNH